MTCNLLTSTLQRFMKITKTFKKKKRFTKTWLHIHRQKIQAIHRLCKPFRNFHSSSVLLCLCGQEESYSRRRPQPPLAELPPPPASQPAPRHHESVLSGRAWDQPVGVRPREPSLLPWAGLDWAVPPLPGSGGAKDSPPCLLLQWAPLCHAAWNPAGADLLRELLLARRGCINSKEPAAYWAWSDSRPCFWAAVLAAWPAELPVRRAVCFWYFCVFLRVTLCWPMIAWKEWKAGEVGWKKTEENGNGLKLP